MSALMPIVARKRFLAEERWSKPGARTLSIRWIYKVRITLRCGCTFERSESREPEYRTRCPVGHLARVTA